MQLSSYHTWNEIVSQPAAWATTLEQMRGHADQLRSLYRDGGYGAVLFTGCGSPYYLALFAAATAAGYGERDLAFLVEYMIELARKTFPMSAGEGTQPDQ